MTDYDDYEVAESNHLDMQNVIPSSHVKETTFSPPSRDSHSYDEHERVSNFSWNQGEEEEEEDNNEEKEARLETSRKHRKEKKSKSRKVRKSKYVVDLDEVQHNREEENEELQAHFKNLPDDADVLDEMSKIKSRRERVKSLKRFADITAADNDDHEDDASNHQKNIKRIFRDPSATSDNDNDDDNSDNEEIRNNDGEDNDDNDEEKALREAKMNSIKRNRILATSSKRKSILFGKSANNADMFKKRMESLAAESAQNQNKKKKRASSPNHSDDDEDEESYSKKKRSRRNNNDGQNDNNNEIYDNSDNEDNPREKSNTTSRIRNFGRAIAKASNNNIMKTANGRGNKKKQNVESSYNDEENEDNSNEGSNSSPHESPAFHVDNMDESLARDIIACNAKNNSQITLDELEDLLERLREKWRIPDNIHVHNFFHTLYGVNVNTAANNIDVGKRINVCFDFFKWESFLLCTLFRRMGFKTSTQWYRTVDRCFYKIFDMISTSYEYMASELHSRRIWKKQLGETQVRYNLAFLRQVSYNDYTSAMQLESYMLDRFYRLGFTKDKYGNVLENIVIKNPRDGQIYDTRTPRVLMSIAEFIERDIQEFVHSAMWMNKRQGKNLEIVSKLLSMTFDPRFPFSQRGRRCFAFLDGVYDADDDLFFFFKDGPIPKHLNPCNFFDTEFKAWDKKVGMHYIKKRDGSFVMQDGTIRSKDDPPPPSYMSLDTSAWDGILRDQRYTEDCDIWWYFFFGRKMYPAGTDNLQMGDVHTGVGGAGKSLGVGMQLGIYPPDDVGVISNNIESKFGLAPVADKWIVACLDVRSNFGLVDTDLLQIYSAERMSLPDKNNKPIVKKWSAVLALCGNQPPGGNDIGGAKDRRFFNFPYKFRPAKINLMKATDMYQQYGAAIRKANLSYMYGITQIGKDGICMQDLPEILRNAAGEYRAESNKLEEFFSTGIMGIVPPEDRANTYIPKRVFIDHFKSWCEKYNNGVIPRLPKSTIDNFLASNNILPVIAPNIVYNKERYKNPKEEFWYGIDLSYRLGKSASRLSEDDVADIEPVDIGLSQLGLNSLDDSGGYGGEDSGFVDLSAIAADSLEEKKMEEEKEYNNNNNKSNTTSPINKTIQQNKDNGNNVDGKDDVEINNGNNDDPNLTKSNKDSDSEIKRTILESNRDNESVVNNNNNNFSSVIMVDDSSAAKDIDPENDPLFSMFV